MAYAIKRFRGQLAALGDNPGVAGVANKKLRVLNLVLSAHGGVNNVILKNSGGATIGQFNLAAGEKFVLDRSEEAEGWCESVAGSGIDFNLSAATAVTIFMLVAAVD